MPKPNYSHFKRKHLSLGDAYFLVKRINVWDLDSWWSWCGLWFMTTINITICLCLWECSKLLFDFIYCCPLQNIIFSLASKFIWWKSTKYWLCRHTHTHKPHLYVNANGVVIKLTTRHVKFISALIDSFRIVNYCLPFVLNINNNNNQASNDFSIWNNY